MVKAVIIFGVFAALYWFRGRDFKNPILEATNAWAYAVAYGLVMGFYDVKFFGVDLAVGVPEYHARFNLTLALLCFAAMKIVTGLGRDVSGFYNNPPKQQNNLFDGIDPDRFANRPVARTAYRLFLQGLIGGFLIALPTHSLWPMLGGLAMPAAYYFGCYILDTKYGKVKDGLKYAEPIFGGLFGLACTTAVWFSYAG